MQYLLKFIELENKRLNEYYKNVDNSKMILARTVKLAEELGELSAEILLQESLQRKEKLNNHSKEGLSEEFADVIITTLLLAKAMDIDIKKALDTKIEKINNRYDPAST